MAREKNTFNPNTQKALDRLQNEEIIKNKEKNTEQDNKIDAIEKDVEDLKKKGNSTKDNEQDSKIDDLKKDIDEIRNSGISKNDTKDKEQDKIISHLLSKLHSESLRIAALQKNIEDEAERFEEIAESVYNMKQSNTKGELNDSVQDTAIEDLRIKSKENKITDAEQDAKIAQNKLKVSSTWKYVESIDKRLLANSKNDKFTKFLSVVSIILSLAAIIMVIF